MPVKSPPLSGAAIVDALKQSAVEFVISVPDRVTSESVLCRVASDAAIKLVRVCKEDEGVSICAALSVCGKRALLLMQHTGLLDSLNALRVIGVEFSQPVVMMVGLLGHESGTNPAQSPRYNVRIVTPILDAMGIAYEFLHGDGDEKRIGPAIARAYANNAPLVLLIGKESQRMKRVMKRDECLKLMAKYHRDEVVVSTYQAAFEWTAIKPESPNYTAVGAMGQASSHGLGLALGLPERRVWVFDGDGSLLMNLGSLVTIANAAPENFLHFLCENGTYETNGGHPIPGAGRLSFAGLAREAGYAEVHEFSEIGELEIALPAILHARGPVFVNLKVETGARYPENFGYLLGSESRAHFKTAIGRA